MLVYKGEADWHTGARHLIHQLNASLDRADKALAEIKAAAGGKKGPIDALDRAYPEDLFSSHKGDLDKIDKQVDGLFSGAQSHRQATLKLQQQVTGALLDIEESHNRGRGVSKPVDDFIDSEMNTLMVRVHDVSGFMDVSSQRRAEKVQELLDDPSPSVLMNKLGVHVTQKQMAQSAADETAKWAVDRNDGTLYPRDIDRHLEDVLDDTLGEVTDVCEQVVQRNFEPNESRMELISRVRRLPDDLWDKVMNAAQDRLVAALDEEDAGDLVAAR